MRWYTIMVGSGVRVQLCAQLLAGGMSGNGMHQVHYDDAREPIVLEVGLSGEAQRFMFDSGAPTFISVQLQAKHSYEVVTYAMATDAGGLTDSIPLVVLDTLDLGPFQFVDVPALVLDLEHTGAACDEITGNFGSNVARHLVVGMDIQSGSVTFADHWFEMPGKTGTAMDFDLDDQLDILFTVELNGDVRDTVYFDTGSGAVGDLSMATIRRLQERYPEQVLAEGKGVASYGVYGPGEAKWQAKVHAGPSIVGGYLLDGLRFGRAGDDRSRLGRGILDYGAVMIDYPRRKWAYHAYASPPAKDIADFGFTVVVDEGGAYVGAVWSGSDAERNGLECGDRLLRIGSWDLTSVDGCALDEIVRSALSGTRVRLVIMTKQGEHRKVTLQDTVNRSRRVRER